MGNYYSCWAADEAFDKEGSKQYSVHVSPKSLSPLPSATHGLLYLDFIQSVSMQGKQLKIDSSGIDGLKNGIESRKTYFGSVKSDMLDEDVDFVLSSGSEAKDSNNPGRHFQISQESPYFYIQDLGAGFGTYIQLAQGHAIEDDDIIYIGENILLQVIISSETNNLSLKVNGGANDGLDRIFLPSYERTYSVGRGQYCDMRLKDNWLSSNQLIVWFENSSWYMKDGNGTSESTNGTWLYARKPIRIYDKMKIKSYMSIIEARVFMNQ